MKGRLFYLKETDSTNEELKRRYAADNALADGTVAVADIQTAGKGRCGRSWQTDPGENIAMSIFLKPRIEPDRASMLTLVAALAVREACHSLTGLDLRIKWPNDILAGRKKICGILTEMSVAAGCIEYVIVGIGVNVNTAAFPASLYGRATSLFIENKKPVDREALTELILKAFRERYELFLETGSLAHMAGEYNSHLAGIGESVRILDPGGEYEGICEGIDERGELLVRRNDGSVEKVYSGEISVRGDWYS